jgi:hypothetical protein
MSRGLGGAARPGRIRRAGPGQRIHAAELTRVNRRGTARPTTPGDAHLSHERARERTRARDRTGGETRQESLRALTGGAVPAARSSETATVQGARGGQPRALPGAAARAVLPHAGLPRGPGPLAAVRRGRAEARDTERGQKAPPARLPARGARGMTPPRRVLPGRVTPAVSGWMFPRTSPRTS